MNTDDLFYRLLKFIPSSFFELIGLPATLADRYRFDSVELIKGGVRVDGVFQPTQPDDPVYLVEVQFYRQPTFFADLFLKVFGYLKENDPAQDWRAVAVFASRSIEPTEIRSYEMLLGSPNVTRIYLDELPPNEDPSLGIGLWQLVEADENQVRTLAPKLLAKARTEIEDASQSRQMVQWIEELLIRKFAAMSREEVGIMFPLKDIRETRVYQEALEEGEKRGEEKGKRKLAQKLLADGIAPNKVAALTELPLKEIKAIDAERQ